MTLMGEFDGIERFRHYLMLLARGQMAGQAHTRIDASDVVQQTLLEAHRQRNQFRGRTDAELAGWLRAMLACNLADAGRALHRAKRDIARERSLEAALEQSSSRLEGWLAAAQSSPSQRSPKTRTTGSTGRRHRSVARGPKNGCRVEASPGLYRGCHCRAPSED